MKKQFCILLALFFCLSAFGCGSKKINGSIRFTVDPDSVTPEGLVYRVIGLPGAWSYGEDYVLERQQEGEWTAVPFLIPADQGPYFISIGYFGIYGKKRVDWTWLYGDLSEGRYRIGKTFSRKGKESVMLWAEFEIPSP